MNELSLDLLDQVAKDSLDLVELFMAIEEKWHDELSGRDVTEAESIRELLRWIRDSQDDTDVGPVDP